MNTATLRLFNALIVEDNSKVAKPSKALLTKTTNRGFVFAPEVIGSYSENELIQIATKTYNTSAQWNQSFHKSWQKVRDASMQQLVMEQIFHYFTTYGAEHLGIYNEDSVYVPRETLSAPEIDSECYRFVVIKGLNKEELKVKTLSLLDSGIALGEDTISDVMAILAKVGIEEHEIMTVKNKEVRCILYSQLNKIPHNNVEFLRYLVYTATDSALLIKSPAVIAQIKAHGKVAFAFLFSKYEREVGLESLAEIFYRFKPIFLAIKNEQTANVINRIRRLAKKNHKAMPIDFLNSVTSQIKNGVDVNGQLAKELKKVNCFRKIRLAYALNFRAFGKADSILYQVRNGKGYVDDFSFKNKRAASTALQLTLDAIAKDVAANVSGKKVFIPDFVDYAMPATEKQFIGKIPSGTCVRTESPMVAGVHWVNTDRRVDLDLALLDHSKIGWDASYRTKDVLFSGDMTDAPQPDGASELFRVNNGSEHAYLMTLNYYNYDPNPVQYEITVGKASGVGKQHTIDPNNMLVSAECQMEKRQQLVGLLTTSELECKFYFCNAAVGNRATSGVGPTTQKIRAYLFDYSLNPIGLKEVLEKAGAEFVDDVEEADIDLSIENLDKTTILDLFKK